VIGHLGNRVSALVDGQLPAAESERLWAHVHACPTCRFAVEREGWVKTRVTELALNGQQPCAPGHLTGSLARVTALGWPEPEVGAGHDRRRLMAAAIGVGSVGAAFIGVFAMTVPAAQTPGLDRRLPTTSLTRPTESSGSQGGQGTGTGARDDRPARQLRLGTTASARLALADTSEPK
jgi:anti-sigma factor RsiW